MFLSLRIENFLSFHDPVEFSARMENLRGDDSRQQVVHFEEPVKEDLLKILCLMGPNGAGKSNLIRALIHMRNFVLQSPKRRGDEPTGVIPFKLKETALDEPTSLDISFIWKQIRYDYGYKATNGKVLEETLYYYPKGRRSVIFERHKTDQFYFNKQKEEQNQLAARTLPNVLYFSNAAIWNFDLTRQPFEWFNRALRPGMDYLKPSWEDYTARSLQENTDLRERFTSFLKGLGLGIQGIRIHPLPEGHSPSFLIETLHKQITREGKTRLISFSLEEESLGIRRIFQMLGPWLYSAANGYTLVVDEMDSGLHPLLSEFLVYLFNRSPAESQLIFSTHNPMHLKNGLFRRDQVYLFSRTPEKGNTEIQRLSQQESHKDSPLLENYLSGNYGAIPVLGQWNKP